jgi:D-3-phosphoglycerate dehydrogenase
MKVLIADNFSTPIDKQLEQFGFEVVYDGSLNGESLTDVVKTSQADILVVRSTKVNADVLQAGVLSVVIRAGAGTNTIDIDMASQIWYVYTHSLTNIR